jgi:quercetin dioxygenase-like cupin family protein
MLNRGATRARPRAVLVSVLALVCSFALAFTFADEPAQEQPLVFAPDDPRLEWGPCPDFFPQGCALAVLQGDPAQPNADVFLTVPPNSVIPRHWHTSAERMVLISGEFHLHFDGYDPQVATPGTYMYGPARLPHQARCAASQACILFIAFEEPVDAIPAEEVGA